MITAFFEKNRYWVKCCGIVWAVLAVTYLCYAATFFLGNHDFHFVRYGMSVTAGVFEGRFSQFLPPYFLTLGQILPILNVWFGFLFLSVGAVLLAKWYGVKEKAYLVVFFGLLIVLNPYFLTQFYYAHLMLSFCFWHFLSIVGVILIYEGGSKKNWGICVGVICLVLSFGGYAASMELVAVILLGKMWFEILSGRKIDRVWGKFYLKVALGVVVGLLIYLAIISLLKILGLISLGMYNVQTLSMTEILQKFLYQSKEPFKVLSVRLPVYGNEVVWGSGVLCALALFTGFMRKKITVSFVLIIGLVYASFLLAFVSAHSFFYVYRVHCYSVPYVLGILFLIICRYGTTGMRNLALGVAGLILVNFAWADFEVQKVWLLGNGQDERLVERVRQQVFPLLKKGTHYRLVTLGDVGGQIKFSSLKDKNLSADMRERYREFYPFEYFVPIFFSGGLFFYEAENPIWADALKFSNGFFYFLSNERVAKKDRVSALVFAQNFGNDKKEMVADVQKMRAYPHPNYYFVGEKDIFLMFENGEEDRDALVDKLHASMR